LIADINIMLAVEQVFTLKGGEVLERAALQAQKYDLLHKRWKLVNRKTSADPHVIPGAVWWIDREVAEINKTLEG